MNDTEMKMPLCQAAATPSAAGEKLRLPEQPRAPSGAKLTGCVSSVEELQSFLEQNADAIFLKARTFCRGNQTEAAELFQELYPRLLNVLQNSNDGTLRNPWGITHTILARLAIDEYRKLRRTRQRIKRLEFPDSIPDHHSKTDYEASDIEELCRAVDGLPPRLKSVVVGIFIEGCKAKDVARTLGLSEARLAELKKLALEHLKEVLA